MLLCRGYDKWHGIYFLGYHFSAVAIGRKLYVIVLVCLGSALVVMCCRVRVCGRQLIFLVFFRKRDCLLWGYWYPCWGHWTGCGYTAGRRCFTIVPWSWLFPGKLWPDIFPWKTLNKWSGCPPACVKISVSLRHSKLCLTSGIWLWCERWLLFFDALPIPCSLMCHVLFLIMRSGRRWFNTRCAQGRGLWPSAIVSLWRF